MKIYSNPNCSKSIAAICMLNSHGINFEEINYLKSEMSTEQILEIANALKLKVQQIVRTKEAVYKGIDIDWSDDQKAAEAIRENPILLERPIVINGTSAVIARPIENLAVFLGD